MYKVSALLVSVQTENVLSPKPYIFLLQRAVCTEIENESAASEHVTNTSCVYGLFKLFSFQFYWHIKVEKKIHNRCF